MTEFQIKNQNLKLFFCQISITNRTIMTVLSKFAHSQNITKPLEQGRDPKEGGWFKGDFHVWIENIHTGECRDFGFPEHNITCMMNNCDINKPVFKPWSNQEKWLKTSFNQDYWDYIPEIVKHFKDPQYQCCPQNCIAWVYENEERRNNHKLVIGSRGWMDNDSDKVWYEWG